MLKSSHFRGVIGAYRTWAGPTIARKCLHQAQGIVSTAGGYIASVLGSLLESKAIYSTLNPIADEFFEVEDLQDDRTQVLWVGYISERKNLLRVIEAFNLVARSMPEARLRLIGGVSDAAYFARVKEQIARCGLERTVSIEGVVEQQTLLRA